MSWKSVVWGLVPLCVAGTTNVAFGNGSIERSTWISIADSSEDYSSEEQGANGWWYLWANNLSGTRHEMIFDSCDPFGVGIWRSACGSYCVQSADEAHPNAIFHCGGWYHGCQKPVRRWVADQGGRYRVNAYFGHYLKDANGIMDGVKLSVIIDGITAWSSTSSPENGNCDHNDWFEFETVIDAGGTVETLSDARFGCTNDRHQVALWIESLDCNDDGMPDNEQIELGLLSDEDGNWIPDCCESTDPCDTCTGDVVPDAVVDGSDLAAVVAGYGTSNFLLDVDGSGVVDAGDILTVCAVWGPCN